MKRPRTMFITNYNPPVRHRYFSRYPNGITLRCGRFAMHLWVA